MRTRFGSIVLVLVFLVAPMPLLADDLTGSKTVICSMVQATRCYFDGDCMTGPPWNWGIPQFIEIDFEKKTLSTTKASGENRSTPFKNYEREGNLVFLQGVEAGRAFSMVIDEESGLFTFAVASDGVSVAAFGACTPMPAPK
jgi:hypothetical protein